MTQRANRDASAEIEIAFASNVIHVTSRTVAQHEIKTPVAGNYVLVEKGLNGRQVIAHNGWRRWNNFFHALHIISNKPELYCETSRREEECERARAEILFLPVQMLMKELETSYTIDGVRTIEKL